MMKKTIAMTILAASTLAGFTSTPAHAISEAYRAQLERSGCTQLTDGNGCDIHKSKAQNQARQQAVAQPQASQRHGKADPKAARAVQAEILPRVRDKDLAQAIKVMTEQGWTRVGKDGVTWQKAGFHAFLNQDVDSRKVVGVTID